MPSIKGKRILFFAPNFFSYDKMIAKKLEEMGATVDHYDERPGNSFYIKSLLRVYPEGLTHVTKTYYKGILSKVENNRYDYVFIVNIEAMNGEIIEKLRSTFNNATFILYMWDSSRNKKSLSHVHKLFDHCFTFDRFDADNIPGLHFRPLFYIDFYGHIPRLKQEYDLSFVGTAHGDRSYIIRKVQSQMQELGLRFYYYLYLNSLKMYLFYKVSNQKFRSSGSYKQYSFNALEQQQIVKLIAASNAVLDIQHEMQTGLTMRTLEVMGAGKKLITTNVDIVNYDFYHQNNILIINRDNPIIDKAFFNSPYHQLSPQIKFKYSLEGWITEIFSLDSVNTSKPNN